MRRNCAKACRSCNEMDMDVFDEDDEEEEEEEEENKTNNEDTSNTNTNTGNDRDTNVGRREDVEVDDDNGVCIDERTECEVWARNEHCEINPGYMLRSCKRACGVCADTREDTNTGIIGTTTRSGREDRGNNNGGTCEDSNVDCASWVNDGACEANPGYALRNCRKSCKNCKDSCRDEHTLCAVWGRNDNCNTNPGYMLRFCQKTCNICQ